MYNWELPQSEIESGNDRPIVVPPDAPPFGHTRGPPNSVPLTFKPN